MTRSTHQAQAEEHLKSPYLDREFEKAAEAWRVTLRLSRPLHWVHGCACPKHLCEAEVVAQLIAMKVVFKDRKFSEDSYLSWRPARKQMETP